MSWAALKRAGVLFGWERLAERRAGGARGGWVWPGHWNPWWIPIAGMSGNGPGPGEEGAEGAGLLTSWGAGQGWTGFPAWGLVVRQMGEAPVWQPVTIRSCV